jgi:hypothetical protein
MRKLRNLFDFWHYKGMFGIFIGLIFLSIGLAGCSDDDNPNGGGDDSSLESLLDGTYSLFTISNDGYNQENDVDFDGEGGLTSVIIYDSNGDTGDFSGTYAVDINGETTIDDTDSVGMVSADGGSFSLVDTALSGGVDTELMIGFAVKQASGGSLDAADLNGDYVFCQVRYEQDGSYAASSYFNFTFNGDNTWSGEITYDSDDSTGAAISGGYTISADGEIIATIEGMSKVLTGRVSEDTNIIALIDEEDPNDEEILIMVGLKKTSGADNTLLSGDYQMVTFGIAEDVSSFWSSQIDLDADGAGNIDADITADSDDETGSVSLEYTVNADGTMTMTTGEYGIVSSDGEMFIIVDTGDGDTDVMLGIGIKKS